MTPSSNPPITAPGTEPSPPIIIAIRPFSVAHMPNIGVTCWSTASTRKPATPPIADAAAKASITALHIDPDQMRRDRIADDGAQSEAETAAIEHELHARRQRQARRPA